MSNNLRIAATQRAAEGAVVYVHKHIAIIRTANRNGNRLICRNSDLIYGNHFS